MSEPGPAAAAERIALLALFIAAVAGAWFYLWPSPGRGGPPMETLLYVFAALALYLLPAIVAISRRHRSAGGIVVLNIFLGWTLLGWVIALSWAASYAGEGNIARPVGSRTEGGRH